MPIDNWLCALAQTDHSAVDGDLEALAAKDYPFLSDQNVSKQIEQLSGHLGPRHNIVRRLVIAYSLYSRQVDAILETGARAFCGSSCPRAPSGCCNREHFVIMNMSDLMSSRNSPTALHMAHVIGQLQQLESAHDIATRKRTIRPGFCSLLAEDGCTLRLFKSPRCVHYMCDELKRDMLLESGGKAQPLLAAMRRAESSTISSPMDYSNPDIIAQAVLLHAPGQAQA